MTNEDILTLAKAGFTAQQIAALSMTGLNKQPAPAPQPQAAPEQPAPIVAAAPAPTAPDPATPAPAPQSPATADDVLKAMQQMMLLQTQQPKQPTAEDILAEIINPPLPKKEE